MMSALIELTRGYQTVVDEKLQTELGKYNWYASGTAPNIYAARRMLDSEAYPRTLIYLHHQVLGIYPADLAGKEIDHQDGNTLNNQLYNLQIVTHLENMQSYAERSARKGVAYDSRHGKWKAYVDSIGESPRRRLNVGTFKTEEEATAARTAALHELGMTR